MYQVNLSASIEQVNLDSWPDSDENLPWATRNPAGSASSSIFFIHLFLPYSTILVFPIQPSFPSLFNHPFLPFSSILAFPFTYPFLPIFIHPFVLFSSIVSFPFNLSFPPYSSILSIPFHPSFPFLAFTIHPSFPSFFISSIIFYLFYLFLNLFISISSFLNFFIPLLICFCHSFFHYLSVGNQRLGSVSISRYLQHQDSSSSIFKDLEQDEVQDFQEIRINHRVPELENQLIQPDKTER